MVPEIFPHSGPRVSLGLVVGVSAGTAALLLLALLLLVLLLRQAGAKTGSAIQDTGSMQFLHCPAVHTPRLSTPPPKPPRSYSQLPDPELQGLPLPSFPPPLDLQYLNTPGNRTSIGTVSLVSTYYEPTSWQLTSRSLPPAWPPCPGSPSAPAPRQTEAATPASPAASLSSTPAGCQRGAGRSRSRRWWGGSRGCSVRSHGPGSSRRSRTLMRSRQSSDVQYN